MHRANPKKAQALVLRIVAYGVTITLSLATTVALLYVSLGYQLDRKSGEVIRNGLLRIDNKHEPAEIYIDGDLRDNAAPGRFVLPAGYYDVSLRRSGYHNWSKNIEVTASGVRNVTYPILIPEKLKPTSIGLLDTGYVVAQSRDRKQLLVHTPGADDISVITIQKNDHNSKSIILPDVFREDSSEVGIVKSLGWARDNKHILLEHTLPDSSINIISLNLTKPDESINITSLYKEVYGERDSPTSIKYATNDGSKVYGLSDGVLNIYSLNNAMTERPLLSRVRSYHPYSEDIVLFDRSASSGLIELGIMEKSDIQIISEENGASPPHLLSYAEYDGNFYFVAAASEEGSLSIYRNPLKSPKKVAIQPFVSLKFAKPLDLSFSDSSQFLLVQNEGSAMTYDLENFKKTMLNLDFEKDSASKFSWLGSHHLKVKKSDGTVYLMEFDGGNSQELLMTRENEELYFSDNLQYIYRFMDTEDSSTIQLEAAPLIVK